MDDINQNASILMKRGIALLDANTPASLQEAITCFDSAIELRQQLPLHTNPLIRYGLAAGWINRGDALARLGSNENQVEALRSYDAALEILNGLEVDSDPLFRRRLAIAWQNRGLLLQEQNDVSLLGEAESSFKAAIAALQEGNAAQIPDRDYLLAAARLNYAKGLSLGKTLESMLQAKSMAREAMALADRFSAQNEGMADVSLKARHILCRALTQLLVDLDGATVSTSELIGDATDAAEEGLVLVRAWEARGVERFRPVAQDLFQFAARVYRIFQPQFFNEFLLEHFNPWPESPESRAK